MAATTVPTSARSVKCPVPQRKTQTVQDVLKTLTYEGLEALHSNLQDQKAQKEREIAALGYGRLPKSAMGKQLQQEAASLKRLEAAVLERLTEMQDSPTDTPGPTLSKAERLQAARNTHCPSFVRTGHCVRGRTCAFLHCQTTFEERRPALGRWGNPIRPEELTCPVHIRQPGSCTRGMLCPHHHPDPEPGMPTSVAQSPPSAATPASTMREAPAATAEPGVAAILLTQMHPHPSSQCRDVRAAAQLPCRHHSVASRSPARPAVPGSSSRQLGPVKLVA